MLEQEKITPTMLVDFFIGDCLIADKNHTLSASDIYNVFEAYCEQLDYGVPCEIRFFGKRLNKRFQTRRVVGKAYYFCNYKPGLFAAK